LPRFPPDVRRWIRHSRDLQGYANTWAQSGVDPTGPRLVAPWLSDYVQLTTEVPPIIGVAAPTAAAGANFVLLVPRNENWRFLSLVLNFVTDANAANRLLRVELLDTAGLVVWRTLAELVQVASTNFNYTVAHQGTSFARPAGGNIIFAHTPPDLWLPAGFTLRSQIVNIQVGDAISAGRMVVEVWPGT